MAERFPKRAVLRDTIEALREDVESPEVMWANIEGKPTTFPAADLGQPGGPAQLDGTGKVSASELPPLEHDSAEAATEVAMLALANVSAPAICIRTDFSPAHVFYLSVDPASTLANWHDTGAFSAAAASPSASVGPVVTNGAAATYMRSDAAPAINLTAAYSWTDAHIFGLVSTDAPVDNQSSAVVSSGSKAFSFSGLTPSTIYYGYMMHENAVGLQSSVAASGGVTTNS